MNSANYSSVICYEKGQYVKEKILEIDQDDIFEAQITFRIDENGFLRIQNDDVIVKYNNEEERLKEFIQLEKNFNDEKNEEQRLNKLKYELDSKLTALKQYQHSHMVTQYEKSQL